MISEVSLSPCLYVLCFLRESVFFSFTRVFKMCILHFSSIVLIDSVHFQICWLTRIHSTHIIKIDWLRRHDNGGKGKRSVWMEKGIVFREVEGLWESCWQITGLFCNLQNEEGENPVHLFFKHFLITFYVPDKVLGVKVTKLPWSLQNIHILQGCISFLLLS